ncbi:hypothetical protein [Segetibacter aerophilus]|uniref:Beta-carotene 15,15'-monooxygenase n=1 Tax=Segetibacter aerophilus TaxID=670293 RepID=A0A512BEF9_9BACT|nr:hypothetical protein [Segetibacter aerophilus]GEO10349.1 hypothetical protein SAE01_28450 [Segetibacter aerophilus]
MVALFKDRSPAAVVWLFILSFIVHSHFIVDVPVVPAGRSDGLLSVFLSNYIAPLNPVIVIFIYHAFVIIQALRINYLFNDHRMYSKNNFLAAMVYILLTGIFKEWGNLTPALIENILVIWLFAKTIRLYNNPNPKTLLFNIGLLIGIGIILYHPSALLILVAFFALTVVRPFVITEWVVLLMGVVFPYYFLASYLYLTDRLSTILLYIPNWGLNIPRTTISPAFFVTVGLILIILILGMVYSQQETRRLLIQVRKNWVVLTVMLLVMLPIPFINKGVGIDSLLLWIVPASPYMAKAFLGPKKNTLPNLMFWSLLVLALVKNWQVVP